MKIINFEFYWIEAKVFLFPTKMGGKSWDIINHYHPNLVWGFNSSISSLLQSGVISLTNHRSYGAKGIDGLFYFEEEKQELGRFFKSIIRMVKVEWFSEYVKKGNHFLIREGQKVVGFGIMLDECVPLVLAEQTGVLSHITMVAKNTLLKMGIIPN